MGPGICSVAGHVLCPLLLAASYLHQDVANEQDGQTRLILLVTHFQVFLQAGESSSGIVVAVWARYLAPGVGLVMLELTNIIHEINLKRVRNKKRGRKRGGGGRKAYEHHHRHYHTINLLLEPLFIQ